MTYTEANKKGIYAWRLSDPEAHKEQQKKQNRAYYEKHRDVIIARLRQKRLEHRQTVTA